MNVWYFGYDFLDTILILLKNEIILLASEKKCKFFFLQKYLKKIFIKFPPNVKFLVKMVDHFKEEATLKNFKLSLIQKHSSDNAENF